MRSKAEHAVYMREWRQRQGDRFRAWARANYARRRADGHKFHRSPSALAAARVRTKAWVKANPEKAAELERVKRANGRNRRIQEGRRKRVPKWFSQKKCRPFYEKARMLTKHTGVLHVVDHIIPLRGELASGLHVHDNLQVLTHEENLEKSNRFTP